MAIITNNGVGFVPDAFPAESYDNSSFMRVMSVMGRPVEMNYEVFSPHNFVPYYNPPRRNYRSLFGVSSDIVHDDVLRVAMIVFSAESSGRYTGRYSFRTNVNDIALISGLMYVGVMINNRFFIGEGSLSGGRYVFESSTLYGEMTEGKDAYLYAWGADFPLVIDLVADWDSYSVCNRDESAWTPVSEDVMSNYGESGVSTWVHDLNSSGIDISYDEESRNVKIEPRVAIAFNKFGGTSDLGCIRFTIDQVSYVLHYALRTFPADAVKEYRIHTGQMHALLNEPPLFFMKMCYISLPFSIMRTLSDLDTQLDSCSLSYEGADYVQSYYPTYAISSYTNSWEESGYSEACHTDFDQVPSLRREGYYGRNAAIPIATFINGNMNITGMPVLIPKVKTVEHGSIDYMLVDGSQIKFDMTHFKKTEIGDAVSTVSESIDDFYPESFFSVKTNRYVYHRVNSVEIYPVLLDMSLSLSQEFVMVKDDGKIIIAKTLRNLNPDGGISCGRFTLKNINTYVALDKIKIVANNEVYQADATSVTARLMRAGEEVIEKEFSCMKLLIDNLGAPYMSSGSLKLSVDEKEYGCTCDVSYKTDKEDLNVSLSGTYAQSLKQVDENFSFGQKIGTIDSFSGSTIRMDQDVSGSGLFRVNDCYFTGYAANSLIDIKNVIFGDYSNIFCKADIYYLSYLVVDRGIRDPIAANYFYSGKYVDSVELPLLIGNFKVSYSVEVCYEQ